MTPIHSSPRPATVLFVEDNEDHTFLLREAFQSSRVLVDLYHVDNGLKCLQFLRQEAPYGNVPRPDLLLLDIRMPLMDGFEVMQALKADERLKSLPVIVMSTSEDNEGVRRMYELGCSSYVRKPVDFSGFAATISQLTGYWFQLVKLPAVDNGTGELASSNPQTFQLKREGDV